MNKQYENIESKLAWIIVVITCLAILILVNIAIQAHYDNKGNTSNIVDCFVSDYNIQIENAELKAGNSYCIIIPDGNFDF